MNYTEKVKKEIINNCCKDEKSTLIFLAGVTKSTASLQMFKNTYSLVYEFKDEEVALFVLDKLKEQFNIDIDLDFSSNENTEYLLTIDKKNADSILKEFRLSRYENGQFIYENGIEYIDSLSSLKRVSDYMKGMFLCLGSVYFPKGIGEDRDYHLEMSFIEEDFAKKIQQKLEECDIKLKFIERESSYSLYSKKGEDISDFLAIVEAMGTVIELNEIVTMREMNNTLNRESNIMASNMDKTLKANAKYIDAIEKIKNEKRMNELDTRLQKIAMLRVENATLSMSELAEKLQITKSSLSRALNKILEISEKKN